MSLHKLINRVRLVKHINNIDFNPRVFIPQAYLQELYGEHYVWLLPGYFPDRWWRNLPNDSDCTADQLEKVIMGYIATEILPISSSEDVSISGFVSIWINSAYWWYLPTLKEDLLINSRVKSVILSFPPSATLDLYKVWSSDYFVASTSFNDTLLWGQEHHACLAN